ncbi:hypothetical protein ABVT39_021664 [Epinephelus coioides]
MEKSRAFFVAQLDDQKQNNTPVAALKTAGQQLESHRIKWQRDKSALIQATEGLRQALLEEEQEWEESSTRSRLEDLESSISKKKKWYRKISAPDKKNSLNPERVL